MFFILQLNMKNLNRHQFHDMRAQCSASSRTAHQSARKAQQSARKAQQTVAARENFQMKFQQSPLHREVDALFSFVGACASILQ